MKSNPTKVIAGFAACGVVSVMFASSAYAACSHGYTSADISDMKTIAENVKPQEAMSTYDPAKSDVLLDTKKPVQDVKTAE